MKLKTFVPDADSQNIGTQSRLYLTSESTPKGVNYGSKDVTQTQQQRFESPTVTLTWHASKYKVHKLHQRCIPNLNSVLQDFIKAFLFTGKLRRITGGNACSCLIIPAMKTPHSFNYEPIPSNQSIDQLRSHGISTLLSQSCNQSSLDH